MPCLKQTRRSLFLTALAGGAFLAAGRSAAAQGDQPGSDQRPQKGDLLVLSEGDRQGEVVRPGDLTLGGPPVHAWPQDGKTSVIRKGLNEIGR
jgi:rieske iron-sulfur protein